MAKALFVHDHRFLLREGAAYSPGKLPASTWERYLLFCDDLLVVGRQAGASSDSARWQRSSGEHVQMRLLAGGGKQVVSEQGRRVGWRQFWRDLKTVDFAIVRHPSLLGTVAFAAMKALGKPTFIECVGLARSGFEAQGGLRGRLLGAALDRVVAWQVRQATGVLYVTRHHLQEVYPTARPSVAVANVALPAEAVRASGRTLQQDRRVVLGFVGDVNARLKGFDTLLEVAELLQHSGLDYTIECVGPAPTVAVGDDVVRRGLQERIRFLGLKPSGSAMWDWYDRVDIFLSLSYSEGLPRTVIEAMARGCAVVATNVGGTAELVEQDWLVEPGDAPAVVRAVLAALGQSASYQRQSLRNVATAHDYVEEQLREKRRSFITSLLAST